MGGLWRTDRKEEGRGGKGAMRYEHADAIVRFDHIRAVRREIGDGAVLDIHRRWATVWGWEVKGAEGKRGGGGGGGRLDQLRAGDARRETGGAR